ncbi:MAG: TonB-dependent receptor [Burkholderiaceae bacterium]
MSAFGHRIDKRHTAYGVGKFALTDDLQLIAGLNVTRARREGVEYGSAQNFSATKTQPFAGLVHDLHPNLSAYGSVASIFQSANGAGRRQRRAGPIEDRTTELGLKFESTDKRLNGVAVFRTSRTTPPNTPVSPLGISYYRGVNATASGEFEAEIAGTVAPGWQLSARASHSNASRVRTVRTHARLCRARRCACRARWPSTRCLGWSSGPA